MMRFVYAACLLVLFGATAGFAQQQYTNSEMNTPRFDLAAGYNYIRANAPPGDCDCFDMQGGFVSANYQLWNWFGITGKVTAGHASDISDLGQNLTLMTFLGGPKVSLPYRRITPYGEALFGAARGTGSYFPTSTGSSTSATSFAFSVGGGIDFNLTRHFAIRAADVQYLRTEFPNGANDEQSQLQIGAGLVLRFGGLGHNTENVPPPVAPAPPSQVALTCSVNVAQAAPGETIQVVGQAVTLPSTQDVSYTWTTTGGVVSGAGHIVNIDTTNVAPGSYQVSGHASLVSNPSIGGDCSTTFTVAPRAEQPESGNIAAAPGVSDEDFRNNMKDAFFDYDSYSLRPDAQQAIQQDATYLNAHPDIQIVIGGYADERGSAEFNLGLGLNRANAARDALVNLGVSASRMEVITYGKEKPFCTEANEHCYQQNRRAQFVLRK